MREASFLIGILILSSIAIFSTCSKVLYKDQHQIIIDEIEEIIKEEKIKEFQKLFYLYRSHLYLNKHDELLDEKKLEFCSKLLSMNSNDISKDQSFYYFLLKGKYCNETTNLAQDMRKLADATTFDNFMQFYKGYQIWKTYKLEKKDLWCSKIKEFFDPAGGISGKSSKKQKDLFAPFHYLPYALEIFYDCNASDSTLIKSQIEKFVQNCFELNKNHKVYYDGKYSTMTTASLLFFFLKYGALAEKEELLNIQTELIDYLIESSFTLTMPEEKFAIFRLFHFLDNYPVVSVERDAILYKKDQSSAQVRIENIFGELISSISSTSLTISLKQNDEIIKNNIQFELNPKSEFNIALQIPSEVIKDFGNHVFEFSYIINKVRFNAKKQVRISLSANVPSIQFEVTQSKDAPEIYTNNIAYGKMYDRIFSVNHNNRVFVSFKINFDDIPSFIDKVIPKLVAIRLKHPQYSSATNLIRAIYQVNNNSYNAFVDLGDPDHVQPLNAQYSMELVIADEIIFENIRWSFAKLSITFRRALASGKPSEDTDFHPLPDLVFNHPVQTPDKNTAFPYTFVGIVSVLILLYFLVLIRMKVNLSKIPKDCFGFFWTICFMIVLIGYICLLIYYWLFLNILEILALISFTIIPTLIIGNFAFCALIKKSKNHPEKPISTSVEEKKN